jgi:spore coat polysaccharide biosynthesis protein SpsF (cytidylyltransferase family)
MKDPANTRTPTAIVQARMGASRLPGKTLADLHGQPLLLRVLDRIRACRTVKKIVVATTDAPEDEAVRNAATAWGAAVYAGSRDDVLDRFYQAARREGAQTIVRITADDPFKDPRVVDEAVGRFLNEPGVDYVSNTLNPTYPEGLDVEVFAFRALETAWREARLASEPSITRPISGSPGRFTPAWTKKAPYF